MLCYTVYSNYCIAICHTVQQLTFLQMTKLAINITNQEHLVYNQSTKSVT